MTDHPRGLIASFADSLGFPLDDFQRRACESIAAHRGVLVAAPTGAGKTVVADFAVYCAMASHRGKAFYTAPIKALSNQKFAELQRRYGAENVGLLTGDNAVNSHARIVVMTTEVLRNMLYAGSDLLDDLAYVVMDEVHYLADRFRGPVWEEVIIQLPAQVRVVSLSATVSNAEEFGDWLREVRGQTDVIVSEFRPVPLTQHAYLSGGLVDLLDGHTGEVNADLVRRARFQEYSPRSRRGRQRQHRPGQRVDRAAVVRLLHERGLLPVISFIFSRAGCDAAAAQVARHDVHLTSGDERRQIAAIVDEACREIPDEDRDALGFAQWRDTLLHGVAAHHAGMLPTFKEVVERLFTQRLVKVVFATETLALGINMPARTVVLEKLEKFNGVERVPITPGEYTQLTGRAGRRGIDDQGHAVVVWHPGMNVDYVLSLATKRTYPLRSRFRPTYNMSINLVDTVGMESARTLLESSFAQFQADRNVVGLARELSAMRESLAGFSEAMACSHGNFEEYAELRSRLTDLERHYSSAVGRQETAAHREDVKRELSELRAALRAHPCHHCPHRDKHVRWAQRWISLKRSESSLERKIQSRTGVISRTFDRVVRVLRDLGYLTTTDGGEVHSTDAGQQLKRIWAERDLLIVECLREGVFSSVDAQTVAALGSVMVYEPRSTADAPVRVPRGAFRERCDRVVDLWVRVDALEREAGLSGSERPSAGCAYACYRWACGASLRRVLEESEMTAGDFVRHIKQVADLLDQIAAVAPPEAARTCLDAIDLLRRGVVMYSSAA